MLIKPFKQIWSLRNSKGLYVDLSNIEKQMNDIEKQLLKDRKECGQCIQNDILLAYVEKALKGRKLKKFKKEFNL